MPNDIPGFPTIVIGGQLFYNIASHVGPGFGPRVRTDGLAIHHSVTQQHYADMAAEVAHIRAIDAYHKSIKFNGFGYNAVVFDSGRVYVVGNGLGQRAHVAQNNHRLEGLVMIGDFRTVGVPLGIILGGARWLVAKYRQHGLKVTQGHRQWRFDTACPGSEGIRAIPIMMEAAAAIVRAGG